ncbi:MAG: hypothetical protein A2X94_13150 [Bdellovibrionales bacterium GWB1_55_8]|nr:MAG: hypothetical protein A2X94_13150 [Bdellovibrionales bacterium GWB1_55_8]
MEHTADNCIFCKIVSGEIPAERLHEDDKFICIRDVRPQAKVHLLLVTKRHIPSLDELYAKTGAPGVGEAALEVATAVARKQGLLPGGFRLVINTGGHGGQTVFHLHIHLLGGNDLEGTFG